MAGPWEKYSQSQETDSGEASGPWAKYQPKSEAGPSGPDAGQAALEHFGNAASFGYLPQLQAAASGITPNPSAEVDAKLRDQGFKINQQEPTYLSERDASIKRLEQEGKEHPIASAAGSVGGALASAAPIGVLAPINAAGKVGRLIQAAKGGALIGAISNPGDEEGKIDATQLTDRAKGAAFGAALSSAGQGAIEGLSAGAKGVMTLPASLRSKAEERAFKASGAMLKDYRKAAGRDRVNELGRFMLDHGLIKPGMTVEDIAQAAASLKSKTGADVSGILSKLDEMGAAGPSSHDLSAAVEKQALPLKELKTAQPTYKTLQDVAGDIKTIGKEPPVGISHGEVKSLTGNGTEFLVDPKTGEVMAHFRDGKLVASGSSGSAGSAADTLLTPTNLSSEIPGTFKGAQSIKSFVDDQIKASGGWHAPNPSEKNQALRDVYTMVKNKIEESAGKAAESSGDKELLGDYLKGKAGYRNSLEIEKIAKDQALRKNANRFLSPSDYGSGLGGAVIGGASGDGLEGKLKGAAIGASLGLANKAARSYGTPLVSLGLDKAGAILAGSPLKGLGAPIRAILSAAEKSPAARVAAIEALSQHSVESGAVRRVAGEKDKGRSPKKYSEGGQVDPLKNSGNQDVRNAIAASFGGQTYPIKKSVGGKIPGRANVAGNSEKNDTVPILASPGEILIPREIAMHKNAPEMAAEFVRHHLSKNGDQSKGEAKWSHSGAQKLGISVDHSTASPKLKRLLIEASDLPQGSKRLSAIKEQIKKGFK